ncbi:MAG TPA: hypothetical protein VK395_26425 [Gemmataceae bacterium]|nr:hypothetical protein [Gemmataceae bacterium]
MAIGKGKKETSKGTGRRGPSGAGRSRAVANVKRQRMSVSHLTAPADDVQYWRSRSPAERLAYVEYLRLINYGQAAVSGRLKRVLEIAQLRPR